jgi:hypothetical protein
LVPCLHLATIGGYRADKVLGARSAPRRSRRNDCQKAALAMPYSALFLPPV